MQAFQSELATYEVEIVAATTYAGSIKVMEGKGEEEVFFVAKGGEGRGGVM